MINKNIFVLLVIMVIMALTPISYGASANNSAQAVTVTVKPTIAISVTIPVNFGSLDADGATTLFTSNILLQLQT